MSDRSANRLSTLQPFPELLSRGGVEPARVFDRAGIAGRPGDDPLQIISRAQLATAADFAARLLGDNLLALHYAEAIDLHQLGPPIIAVALTATLGEGLACMARFLPSLQRGTSVSLRVTGGQATLFYELAGGDPRQIWLLYEASIGVFVRLIRNFLGSQWRPSMIYLPVHRGACSRDYEDFLRVPVRFTDGMAAIRFAAADLSSSLAIFGRGW